MGTTPEDDKDKKEPVDTTTGGAPDAPPERIPFPNKLIINRIVTQDNYLVFVNEHPFSVSFVPLSPGQASRKPMDLEKMFSYGSLSGPGCYDVDPWPFLLSQVDSMVVCVDYNDSEALAWIHHLLHQPDSHREFWRVFYDGRPPQRLFSTTEDIHNFSLSPNGKKMLYWNNYGAHLLEGLP